MLSLRRTLKPSQICSWAPRYFVDVFGDPDAAVTARYIVIYYQTSGRDRWFDAPRDHLLACLLKIGKLDVDYQRRIENGLQSLDKMGMVIFNGETYRPAKMFFKLLECVTPAPLPDGR
jgi:hypothetical protein